ncbi:MAG: 2-C-methyl-D-erythritol 4-phosphate cytidylyltransferase, partial [Actinomycetota bacterium]|nr:2-C-methyl-D-erythritol 4-phosphate cytidylyltransferase [Actinomycetota bacterium]
MSPAAIIVAGGRGRRAVAPDDSTPKQFRRLAGRALFEWSLTAFETFGCSPIVLVVPAEHVAVVHASHSEADVIVVEGGRTRQASVANGLDSVATEHVLVHDAARPFVEQETIARVTRALRSGAEAAIPCIPAVETIKDTVGDSVVTTVDRAQLQIAQTPQGFITTRLRAAHERAVADDFHGTDDAQLFERIGGVVRVVEGSTK